MEERKGYEKLEVWQRADRLVPNVYQLTKSFPKEEIYSITNQIRRAAVSVPTNIVEGWTRRSTKEYIQFLNTSLASCAELEYLLKLSARLGMTDQETPVVNEAQVIIKMLRSLIKSINEKLLEARC